MSKKGEFTPDEAKAEFQRLTTVKEQFEKSLTLAGTGATTPKEAKVALMEAKRHKQELEEGLRELREKINPFEGMLHLREQYDREIQHLATAGLLERLSSGDMGIKSIEVDGKVHEYPIPTLEDVGRRLREKREMVNKKREQGFTKLLLVPFGMPLDTLIEKYKARLLDHHQRGKLFAEKQNPTDPDEPLDLYTAEPVRTWNIYNRADQDGKLVYEPNDFNPQNHGGRTKQEILKSGPDQGWRIVLLEDLPVIPKEWLGRAIGGRYQLGTNKTSGQYLQTFKTNPDYAHEGGMTPEEWLTYAISKLESENQVAEDFQGKGNATFLTGAYFPASNNVPYARWDRGGQRTHLSGRHPDFHNEAVGARARVRV